MLNRWFWYLGLVPDTISREHKSSNYNHKAEFEKRLKFTVDVAHETLKSDFFRGSIKFTLVAHLQPVLAKARRIKPLERRLKATSKSQTAYQDHPTFTD